MTVLKSLLIILFFNFTVTVSVFSAEENSQKLSLLVIFSKYKENNLNFSSSDLNPKEFGDQHDTVQMEVMSRGNLQFRIFYVWLGEYPVRNGFRKKRPVYIRLNKAVLVRIQKERDSLISSNEIEFPDD